MNAPNLAPAQPPTFDPVGRSVSQVRKHPLTLPEMRAILGRGESIMYNGQVISDPRFLPTEAQLAVGDPAAEDAAATHLQGQIDRLNNELKALKDGTLAATRPQDVGPSASGIAPWQSAPLNAPAAEAVGPNGLTESQAQDMRNAQRAALLRAQNSAANEEAPNPPPVPGKNVP